MHILVIGAGNIGRRHIQNLAQHSDITKVTVLDPYLKPIPAPLPPVFLAVTEWESITDTSFDGIIIATPTATHYSIAKQVYDHIPLNTPPILVEKPLALDSCQGNYLTSSVTPIHVAYSMRFHPAIQTIKQQIDAGAIGRPLFATARVGQYLPDWHPDQDYRAHYVAHRDQGGGALLDLSHEIDYLNWMFGPLEYQSGIIRKVSDLEIDADDLSIINMVGADGLVASATMDLLDREYNRAVRVVGSEATLTWEHPSSIVIKYGTHLSSYESFEGREDRNTQFKGELDAWLQGIQTGDYGDLCTLEQGLQVLQLVDELKEEQGWVTTPTAKP